jgi:hypothetical protein
MRASLAVVDGLSVPIKDMKVLIGIAILIGVCLLVLLIVPKSKKRITITDFSSPVEANVRAPIRPFGTGALYVMYEGNLASDARIEVRSNHGRDAHMIELNPGSVQGVYGGPEIWVDDLSIRLVSSAATPGNLRIGLYCGASFSVEDRAWHQRLMRQ